MEAASLTLGEASDVLEEAYGPDHPKVLELRQALEALDSRGASGLSPAVVSLGMPSPYAYPYPYPYPYSCPCPCSYS